MQSYDEVVRKYQQYLSAGQKSALQERAKQISITNAPTRMQLQTGAIKGARQKNEMLSNYGLARSLNRKASSGLDVRARQMPEFRSEMQGLRARETAQLDVYGRQAAEATIAARQRAAEEEERRRRAAAYASAQKRAQAANAKQMQSAADYVNNAIKNGMSEMDAAKLMESVYKGDQTGVNAVTKKYVGGAEHVAKTQRQQVLNNLEDSIASGVLNETNSDYIKDMVSRGKLYTAANKLNAANIMAEQQKYEAMVDMPIATFQYQIEKAEENLRQLEEQLQHASRGKRDTNMFTKESRAELEQRYAEAQDTLSELQYYHAIRSNNAIEKYTALGADELTKLENQLKSEQYALRESGYKNGKSDYARESVIDEQLSLISAAQGNVRQQMRNDAYTELQAVSKNADFAARSQVGATIKGNSLHEMMTSGVTPEMEERAKWNSAEGKRIRSEIETVGLMTDDEKATYNYYLSQSQEAADKYMDQLETYINERRMQQIEQMAQVNTESNTPAWLGGITKSIASVLMTPFEVTGAAYSALQFVSGKEIDPYNEAFAASIYKSSARESVGDLIAKKIYDEQGGEFLAQVANSSYQAVMSMCDNLLLTAIGGVIGGGTIGKAKDLKQYQQITEWYTLLSMSSGAAATTVRDAMKTGATKEQAMMLGVSAGVFETLFEKAPLEHYLGMSADVSKSLLNRTLKQAGLEMSEEIGTEIAGIFTNLAVMGNMNAYNKAISDYLRDGSTMSEARAKAFMDTLVAIGFAAYGGFISGLFMGGVGSISMDASLRSRGKQIQESMGVQTLLDEAKGVGDEKVQKLYAKINNAFEANSKARNLDVGKLDALIQQAGVESVTAQIDTMLENGEITAKEAKQMKEAAEEIGNKGFVPEFADGKIAENLRASARKAIANRTNDNLSYNTEQGYRGYVIGQQGIGTTATDAARYANIQSTINQMQEEQNGLQMPYNLRGRNGNAENIGAVEGELQELEGNAAVDRAGNEGAGSETSGNAGEVPAAQGRASIRSWDEQDRQNLTKAFFDFNQKYGTKYRTDSVAEPVDPKNVDSKTQKILSDISALTGMEVCLYRGKGSDSDMEGAAVRGRIYIKYVEGEETVSAFLMAHEACEAQAKFKAAGQDALQLVTTDILAQYNNERGDGRGDTNELISDMFGAYAVAKLTGNTSLYDEILGEHNQEAIDAFEIAFDYAMEIENTESVEPETQFASRRITDPLAAQMHDMRKQGQQHQHDIETVKQRAARIASQQSDTALANQMADMRKQGQQHLTEMERLRVQQARETLKLKKQAESDIRKLNQQHTRDMLKQERANNRAVNKLTREYVRDVNRLEASVAQKTAKIEEQKATMKRMKVAERIKVQETREKANERHNKEKSLRVAKNSIKALEKMLVSPNKDAHVPTFMRSAVAELVNLVDIGHSPNAVSRGGKEYKGTNEVQRWRLAVSGLRDALAGTESTNASPEFEQLKAALPENFVEDISTFISVMTNNEVQYLADMSSAELRELNRIISTVRGAVAGVNRLYSSIRYKTVEDLGAKTIADSKGKIASGKSVLDGAKKFFNSQMLDFFSWGHEVGDSGEAVTEMVSDGYFNNTVNRVRETQEFMESLYKKHNFTNKDATKWGKETHSIDLDSGETINLSTTEIMELYALSFRTQAIHHILHGGIKSETKGNDVAHPYKITENDLDAMFDILSNEQMSIIDEMQRFMSTTVSSWGNEVTQRLYMYDAFNEDYYWTIRSADESHDTKDPDKARAFNAILNSSFTKQLTPNATSPIRIGDAFSTFVDHCSQMANYNGLAVPLQDTLKWLNYKARNDDGTVNHDATVKTALNRIGNKEAETYIVEFIKDLNGINSKPRTIALAEKLTANAKRAAIAAKVRVVIQQPTSVIRATAMIDPKYFATTKQFGVKRAVQEMQTYAPIAWWKSNGNYEIGLGQSMRDMIMGDATTFDQVNNWLMKPAGLADDLGWSWIWNAVKQETKDTTKLKPNSPEFFEHCAKRFTDVCNATQVIDTPLHRSEIMRSKDSGVKQLTAFMSEPAKNYNIMYRAVLDAARKKPGATKKLGRTLGAVIAAQMVNSLVTALWDSARKRGEDEEETFLKLFGRTWVSNFTSGINPLSNMPFFSDVWDMGVAIVKGKENVPKRMDMDSINSAIKAVESFFTTMFNHDESRYTTYYAVTNLAKQVSNIFGLPVNGVISSIEGIVDIAFPNLIRRYKPQMQQEWQQEMYDSAMASGMKPREFYELYEDLGGADLKTADKAEILANSEATTEQKVIMSQRASDSMSNRLAEMSRRNASDAEKERFIEWYGKYSALESTHESPRTDQLRQMLLADSSMSADEKSRLYTALTNGNFGAIETKIFQSEKLANAEKNALYDALNDAEEMERILADSQLDREEQLDILDIAKQGFGDQLDFSSSDRLALSVLGKSQYDRAISAEKNGVSNAAYLRHYETKRKYTGDKDDETGKADVVSAIMNDSSLTTKQKAALETALYKQDGKEYTTKDYSSRDKFTLSLIGKTYPQKADIALKYGISMSNTTAYVQEYSKKTSAKSGSGKDGAMTKKDCLAIMESIGIEKKYRNTLYKIMRGEIKD